MKKTLTGFLAVATVLAVLAASATDASAQYRGHGWGGGWRGGYGWRGPGWRGPGWRGPGPGIAAGVVAGALVAGAIIATRPPGYVVYEGYGQPVYAPGCYWASQPIYDRFGNFAGYTGQPVQVCPGYQGPPGPPPGYAGPPPGPPPAGYAGPPPGPPPAGYAGPPGGYAAAPSQAGGPSEDAEAYCAQRYRSYDPNTGTFLGNDGQRHPCP
jgi:BA14K-like protein